jgi:cyanoexosortase A
MAINVVFGGAVVYLLWEKRKSLRLQSGIFPSLLGLSIIISILLKSLFVLKHPMINGWLLLSPFLIGLSLALLASGFRGLSQYRRELLLLFFLGMPKLLLRALPIDFAVFTAKSAVFFLWYMGFEVAHQDVDIRLPAGTVEVFPDCSGIESMAYMLSLAVLVSGLLSLSWSKSALVTGVATLIGFMVNAVRVALMAVLVAGSQRDAFEYWHEGSGSLIFSMISVLLFSLFCFFLLRQDELVRREDRQF